MIRILIINSDDTENEDADNISNINYKMYNETGYGNANVKKYLFCF